MKDDKTDCGSCLLIRIALWPYSRSLDIDTADYVFRSEAGPSTISNGSPGLTRVTVNTSLPKSIPMTLSDESVIIARVRANLMRIIWNRYKIVFDTW